MHYTTFTLPSGAEISVESSRPPAQERGGVEEATGVVQKTAAAWSNSMHVIAELAEQTQSQLQKIVTSAKEISVEFGINIDGKAGIVLIEGSAAANLKVILKWQNKE